MVNFRDHLITNGTSIREALKRLDALASDAIVFVVDKDDRLKGSLTDGDVRRGLLKDVTIDEPVSKIIQVHPRFLKKGARDIHQIIQ